MSAQRTRRGDIGIIFFFLGRCRLRLQMILRQSRAKHLKAFFRGIYDTEQVQVFFGNSAGIDQGRQVQFFGPVLSAVHQHYDFLGQLLGLCQSKNFEQLIQGAEAAGKNDQPLAG